MHKIFVMYNFDVRGDMMSPTYRMGPEKSRGTAGRRRGCVETRQSVAHHGPYETRFISYRIQRHDNVRWMYIVGTVGFGVYRYYGGG